MDPSDLLTAPNHDEIPQEPPRLRSPWWPFLNLILLTLIAFALVSFAVAVHRIVVGAVNGLGQALAQGVEETLAPQVSVLKFLEAVVKGDEKAAYSRMSLAFQAQVELEDFRLWMIGEWAFWPHQVENEWAQVEMVLPDGQVQPLIFPLNPKGRFRIQFVLERAGKEWAIDAIWIEERPRR